MVKEKSQFDCGPYAANSCAFDKSGNIIAIASDDGTVKLYGELTMKLENSLKGHEDAVQDVVFDYNSKMMISAGSDSSFRVWQ
jgi:WD40 repeat protein